MRTPVISRFVAASAAALTLTLGLPLLASSPAWACGEDSPTAVQEAPERHAKDPVEAFLPPVPKSVTAGGAPVEIGLEQVNFTGEPYRRLAPGFALFASEPSATESHRLVNLQPEDVTVEVMFHGEWKRLRMRHSCDPTIVADTSSVAEPVADGRAHRYMFRLSLSAKAPKELKKIDVFGGPDGHGRISGFALTIARPKATATPTPKAPTTPAPSPTATTVPAVAVSAPAATPTTAGAEPVTELASTGPSAPTGFLFGSAAALIAFGGGVLYAVRRIAKR
ncbi:hypothetical protein GCM10010193_10910 [Kitasatospora atroaurantiaca]|uniref:LPXTG-motif cell wall-anchored protein n=1 Tax=Kitasatospora atroaurantiaca TaxID=285545 RepID=A0A561ESF9_9ACTN|nr:hypothetical protein [Kitasatospora atroaurantiaca]TWE18539.1 hypothetical protein FB465_3619 [Kitasatospora atroaurantiaca]